MLLHPRIVALGVSKILSSDPFLGFDFVATPIEPPGSGLDILPRYGKTFVFNRHHALLRACKQLNDLTH
jgi:hypothetical protein